MQRSAKVAYIWLVMIATIINAQSNDYKWIPVNTAPLDIEMNVVQVLSSDFIVAGGKNRTFTKTTDGGDSWTLVEQPGGILYDIGSIYFVSELVGWIADEHSRDIVKTTDGGITWSKQQVFSTGIGNIVSLKFFDENNGLVLKDLGDIAKTIDGGDSWVETDVPGLTFNGMDTFSQNSIIVFGERGTYYHSKDFISTWEENKVIQDSIGSAELLDMKIVNENVFYASGEDGLIAKTSDGGETWLQISYTPGLDRAYSNLTIFDEMNGKVQINESSIRSSSDGFSNLILDDTQELLNRTINDFDFLDSQTGWAVIEPYALLGNSTFAKYVEAEPTSVENDAISPAKYSLSQNYPNPFNPSTTISYSIPKQSNVQLKVHDLLGNEVATLVDEYKNGGNYSVSFDAGELSSGLYFYTLKTNDFNETKKMLIVK